MESPAERERLVYIETFGCQMNENDTARIIGVLKGANYRPTTDPGLADLILVNTCSIRDKAEQKVYSTLGRFKRLKKKKPGLLIGVAGCVAQQEGERLLKRVPHLDIVFGPHNIHRLGEMLSEVEKRGGGVVSTELRSDIEEHEYDVEPGVEGVKTYVSIMRGCDNFCSYCIVPYTRGREVSRPRDEIVEEIRSLASRGIKEVTLLGQNVNSYGKGIGATFTELLKDVCRVDGIERVRFVTSHPKDISDELIYLFAEEPKLARALHLPIQSGSNRVLERMRRAYTVEDYLKKVRLLKKLYPDMAITTDIIVGFPGESDEDFECTMNVVREVRFDGAFSFKYSPRPGTLAAGFDDKVPEEVKAERLEELQALQRTITLEKNRSLAGRTMSVLVEGRSRLDPQELSGRTTCNRVVNFPDPGLSPGDMADILITEGYQNSLRGVYKERSLLCS